MLSRRKESLRELIQHQREESVRRHEESERRHEEFLQREEKRKKEFDLYMEKRDEESRDREARYQLLAERAEAREEETREFNREILLRNEKVYTGVIIQMEKNNRRIEEDTEQLRANTQAVLSVLDRLNGPGEAAA